MSCQNVSTICIVFIGVAIFFFWEEQFFLEEKIAAGRVGSLFFSFLGGECVGSISQASQVSPWGLSEVHHDGIFRGRLHNNHNGNLLLGPYTSAPFVSEIMLKKIYPLKYWNGMLIVLYIIEISFCSAGGGWWLVLICYERKVPLVDSWLVASANLVWEKNKASWLADKPVKQRSVCESWSTGGAISLEDWAFTNKAKQILSTRIYSTVHPNKNGHLFIFFKNIWL